MKDFSKAFPTPLEAMRTVYDRDFELYATQIDRGTNYILVMSTTEQDSKDRAELIVTAVNNFDKMKEALEFLIELNQNPEGDPNEILRERRISDIKQLLESLK